MTEQFYEKEARDKLLAGAKRLYDAVKTTMGPKGRNVVIGARGIGPTVTHDGVTVAKAVQVKDEAENTGAELIKEAASKVNDMAGDGTTTVTVLTYQLLAKAAKLIETGASPMSLSREVELALHEVLLELEVIKTPANDIKTLTKIASLSSGDEELGKIVAETVHRVGADGTITVQPSSRFETDTELVGGFALERGYISPYMINDENRQEAAYDNPAIVIVNRKIYSFKELLPLFEKIHESGQRACVLIAEDIEGDALPTLVLNSTQGDFRTLAVKAPSFDDNRRAILDDLAIATGATVISSDTISLDEAQLDVIGSADKVIATSTKTTFIGCGGDIAGRIQQLEAQIKSAKSEHATEQLEKRAAALAGKVAVIRVGGQTDTEIEERKFRVDDAVAATKAALAEGILPGGGVTLYNAKVSGPSKGSKLLADVLKEPFRQLMANSNINVEEAEKFLKSQKPGTPLMGYDVKTGKKVDLLEAGIVDPYEVTRQALVTAVSLGVVGMTAGALIVQEPGQ